MGRFLFRLVEQGAWTAGALNLNLTLIACLGAGALGLVAARGVVRIGPTRWG